MAETARATKKAAATPTTEVEATVVPVHVAWSQVMEEAQGLGKNQRYDGGDGGGKYAFRGIDDVMNLVGPLLRKHRVSIIPSVLESNYRDITITRSNGTTRTSREVTVKVQYAIVGPNGDNMVGVSCGESLDTGDKGTAKAMSVAYRVFLLQSLTLPTDEPDPDSQVYERSGRQTPEQVAQETADRAAGTTVAQVLVNVRKWAAERALLDVQVADSEGHSKPLSAVIDSRIEALTAADPQAAAERQAAVDKALGGSGS